MKESSSMNIAAHLPLQPPTISTHSKASPLETRPATNTDQVSPPQPFEDSTSVSNKDHKARSDSNRTGQDQPCHHPHLHLHTHYRARSNPDPCPPLFFSPNSPASDTQPTTHILADAISPPPWRSVSISSSTGSSSTHSTIETWLQEVKGTDSTTNQSESEISGPFQQQCLKRKRPRSPSIEAREVIGTGVPLNYKLLREHTAAMSKEENPQTPQKRGPDSEAMTLLESDSLSSNPSADALTVARRLEEHMIYKDKPAYQSFDRFKEAVEKVKTSNRLSGVKAASETRYREHLNEYQYDNEDTLLNEILPLIIKRDHGVETESHGEWWSEGLKVNTNREFKRTLLPNCHDGRGDGAEIAKLLKKVDGMTNPKPDRTYGVRPTFLPSPEGLTVSKETDQLLSISPGLIAAFFLIEGKSYAGSMFEAENQARRGGATLVNAGRKLFKLTGKEDVQGADDRTYVYSATLDPQAIKIWIHWAEVRPNGRVHFHMNRIFGCLLDDDNALEKIRNVTHNIIEWGLNERLDSLKEVYSDVWEGEPKRVKDVAVQMQARKDSEREAKKLKRNSVKLVTSVPLLD